MSTIIDPQMVALLGWISGLCVMVSGVPNMVRNLRNAGPAKPSILRDSLQCFGNIGWVTYGLLTGSMPIAVMCAVTAILMTVLIGQQIRRGSVL